MSRTALPLLLVLPLLAVACGGGGDDASTGPVIVDAPPTVAGGDGEGTTDPDTGERPLAPEPFGESMLTGVVRFAGDAKAPRRIDLGSVDYCTDAHPDGLFSESLIVGEEGALANVFVRVKDGLPGVSYEAPDDTLVIDQQGCVYVPHVAGMMLGQDLRAVNSDPIMHNVHGIDSASRRDLFNWAQSSAGVRNETRPRRPGLIELKCEVHSWMKAWVHVVRNPFFAVTGEDGRFVIERLPAGTYEVEAWHEKLGTISRTLQVEEGAVGELLLVFDG